ncbi:MAG: hypothetical protein ABJL67_23575 [Sulfitobacter sp.]
MMHIVHIKRRILKLNGAPEENNLEPFDTDLLLQNLEDWAEVLKGEPEVIHRLEALKTETDDAEGECLSDPTLTPGLEP